MADIVWDGSVAGPLYADSPAAPAVSAYSNGNGVITVNGVVSPLFDESRLIIRNCSVITDVGALGILVRDKVGAKGDLVIEGTKEVPCQIGLSAGIQVTGNNFDSDGPSVYAEHAVFTVGPIRYLGSKEASGTFWHSTFKDIVPAAAGASVFIASGGSSKVELRYCQLVGCQDEGDLQRRALYVGNGATLVVDHLSMLFRTLWSGGQQIALFVDTGSTMTVKNSILTLENTDGAQTSRLATNNGVLTSLGYSFIHFYETVDKGDWIDHATDQDDNPDFSDADCTSFDLRPGGGAKDSGGRDVELWKADEIGWHPGALEPHDLSSFVSVAGAGEESVWGERKQRIYEKSLASEDNVHLRARGVRLQVLSRDERSQKLLAGLWVSHVPERMK